MIAARILRIELRRSVALLAALLIAATGVFVLFASNPPHQSWMELTIVQRDILQLTWPLALAAGAWQGIRERRSRVEELFATMPRPRRWRVLPVATAMAIAAAAAYLVMLAGASGHLRHIDGYFAPAAIPIIALGALAMVAAVWLGLAIGALLPSPLTAPMLVVVGFIGLAVVPPMLRVRDVSDPGAFLLLPYLRVPRGDDPALQMFSTRASLSQALWLGALAAAGLALHAAARSGTRVAAVLPIVLGAAVAVPAMPRHVEDAWVENPHATELVCTADEPRVCVARARSYLLDDLREPARRALSVLAAKLPPAPTRVVVGALGDRPSQRPGPADTLLVLLPLSEYEETQRAPEDRAPEDLVWPMLDGAGVPLCEELLGKAEDMDTRYVAARVVAAAWLLDRDVPSASEGGGAGPLDVPLADQALAELRALPAEEQRARVTALRDAERTCAAGDRLALLSGTSGTR